jgi:hypothetical protein
MLIVDRDLQKNKRNATLQYEIQSQTRTDFTSIIVYEVIFSEVIDLHVEAGKCQVSKVNSFIVPTEIEVPTDV